MVEGRICKEKKGKVWACDSSPPKIGTICRLECEGDKVGGCFCYCLVLLPFLYIWFCRRSVYIFFADLREGKFESVYAHWLGSFSPETWVQSSLYLLKRDFQTSAKKFSWILHFTPYTYYFPSSARPTPPCVLNPCPNLKDKQINHGEW